MAKIVGLTQRETAELRYLARSQTPLWGGHLERGEPITDVQMQRWVDLGLIKAVGTRGYIATGLCRASLGRKIID